MSVKPSSPESAEPLLTVDVVLQEARSLHRYYSEKPDKPYTANVLADCIATIEYLQSRVDVLSPQATETNPTTEK